MEDMLAPEIENIAALGGTIKRIETLMAKMNALRDRLKGLVEKHDQLTYRIQTGTIDNIALTVTDTDGAKIGYTLPRRVNDDAVKALVDTLLKEIQLVHAELMKHANDLGDM